MLYDNLGVISHYLGKQEESFRYILKCKMIKEELFSSNHSELTKVYLNFASILISIGNYKEAIVSYQKCENILTNNLPLNSSA